MVGFKLEETIREDKALECIRESGIDVMVANSTKTINADTAEVVILDGKMRKPVKGTKSEIAKAIMDVVKKKLRRA